MSLLNVNNLHVTFTTPDGAVAAVSNVSFELAAGQSFGIVGESGSGKSQMMLSLLGLLADNGTATGQAMFDGKNLLELSRKELNRIRGAKISMIFQDPMTALNPYLMIGTQLTEGLKTHQGRSEAQAEQAAIAMLNAVQIPAAKQRMKMYPHEFSGGMRQRVMIAMALLTKPDILIADESTTALDVTVQAQIMQLLRDLQSDFSTAIILITHDFGVVAGLCDEVMVMYAGQVMERAPTGAIFNNPQHPYTRGLLRSLPRLDSDVDQALATIPGNPPNLLRLPSGCPFNDRCEHQFERCQQERPTLTSVGLQHHKACHLETPA